MAWALFILLNATLFLRPAELLPQLEGWPIYNVLILGCIAASLPSMSAQLRPRMLARRPITVCVVGLLAAVLLSRLSHLEFYEARQTGLEFLKVVLYFLLFITLVATPERLRQFLLWLSVFTLGLTLLALADYHGLIRVPAIDAYRERQDEIDEFTGEPVVIDRLRSTGIYNNPNDLSRIVVIGMLISIHGMCKGSWKRWRRLLWALPLVVFGHALILTYSRGGLLSLIAGLLALFFTRFGAARSIGLAFLYVPLLFLAFEGRQTRMSTSTGTGQQRIQIWSDGLVLFKAAPVFGIGVGRYVEEVGHVAHNSFVQCFTETGFFGGAIFAGAFYAALVGLYHARSSEPAARHQQVTGLRPLLLAIVAATIIGMFSSTRSYAIPTFMVLGLAGSYLASLRLHPPLAVYRVDARFVRHVVATGLIVLCVFYTYVRFAVQFNG